MVRSERFRTTVTFSTDAESLAHLMSCIFRVSSVESFHAEPAAGLAGPAGHAVPPGVWANFVPPTILMQNSDVSAPGQLAAGAAQPGAADDASHDSIVAVSDETTISDGPTMDRVSWPRDSDASLGFEWSQNVDGFQRVVRRWRSRASLVDDGQGPPEWRFFFWQVYMNVDVGSSPVWRIDRTVPQTWTVPSDDIRWEQSDERPEIWIDSTPIDNIVAQCALCRERRLTGPLLRPCGRHRIVPLIRLTRRTSSLPDLQTTRLGDLMDPPMPVAVPPMPMNHISDLESTNAGSGDESGLSASAAASVQSLPPTLPPTYLPQIGPLEDF